jgi:hypothetical protein
MTVSDLYIRLALMTGTSCLLTGCLNMSGFQSSPPSTEQGLNANISNPANSTPTPTPTPSYQPSATTFMDFPNGYFTLVPNQPVTLNSVSLQLTSAGDIQVVDASQNILWHAGSSANCAVASNCYLVQQTDGNLVLYANNAPAWSSGTYNYTAAFLTFSSVAPYLTLYDSNFNVVWPTAGAVGPTALLSASHTGANAVAVKSFLSSLAINSHVSQNGTSSANMLAMLNYLGVYTIRDGWNTNLTATYTTMAQNGVHFDIGMSDPYAAGALSGFETIAAMAPGALTATEGPNEINNFAFVCNGVTSQTGWPNSDGPMAQSFMTETFTTVHQDPALSGVVVYDMTWAGTTNAQNYGFFSLANQADVGNMHFYPAGQPYTQMQSSFAASYNQVLPNQGVITETGYDTSVVSERAQAIMNLNLYLDGFQQGFQKVYIYELYDEWQTYGVFTSSFTPKASATAIHNLTTILADSGTNANPGSLNYSLSGLPANGHSLLLQKSNGVYELIVWNEAPVYANGADLNVTSVPVTVQLGNTYSKVSVYDPLSSSSATQTLTSLNSLDVSLGSDALIIEVTP